MSISRLLMLAIVIAATVASTPACAQSDDADALFREGVTAAREHRWAAATTAFQEAYELTGRAELLINIATSLAEQAQWAAARASYVRFLESAPPPLRAAHQERVQAAIRRAEAHAGSLQVSVHDQPVGSRVLIDGVEAMPGERVWVDPGAHRVGLSEADDGPDDILVHVRSDELRSVVLGADAPHLGGPSTDGDESASDELVWVAVIAALVVAAGIAIGVTIELTRERGFVGNLGPGRWVTALFEL